MSDADIKNKIDETWHKLKENDDGSFNLSKNPTPEGQALD
jgi:hypothetical protein